MQQQKIITSGEPLSPGRKVLILLHGRGGTAEDILSLSSELSVKDFALIAPQAEGNSWYPYSFLAAQARNEPWVSAALDVVEKIVQDLDRQGIDAAHIYFAGFSQGACLTLEFVARHAQKYGGVAAFTGGLIGDMIYHENYAGDFQGTPIFIGGSDADPHVPAKRMQESATVLRGLNAAVTEKLYSNMGHTINSDELQIVNNLLFEKHPTL